MSVSENTTILNKMYRTVYDDKEYFFEEILKKAILRTLTDDTGKAEVMAASKVNRLWNDYKKQYEDDISNGIVPLFSIVNDREKKVRWIGKSSETDIRREYYKTRPELYKFFDRLNDREYEVMACVICELLGADKISLTAPGNEGGVDFFARVSFPPNAHFLFGMKGPIRIVGQCKKYTNKDNVGHMKEFITTMNNVYNRSFRIGEILPDWFKLEKGNIIGWHIANSGHQTGALDVAKNYGILVSDTKQLIEVVCNSKVIRRQKEPVKFLKNLMKEDKYIHIENKYIIS